ncbi:DNA-binding response regulator [Sphingobacterium faecium NBRC 15299]|nr:LytTR family two component transcriptional regulator [Sphingobacterium faecium]GEM63914.1 DNA-binding response regulator [Sphingobacterium faecium NBRC 15299]
MINCYIIDDMPVQFKLLSILIKQHAELNLIGADTNAEAFLTKHRSGELEIDLLFLDIEMPGISGIDLAKLLLPNVKVIFVTGHRDFALDAFDLHAVDYLLKPIHPERFAKAIEKVVALLGDKDRRTELQPENQFLVVKGSGKASWIKLAFDKIISLEADSNYTTIYYEDTKIMIYGTLGSMEQKLDFPPFMRIHKSHIVNLDHVQKGLRGEKVILSNQREVPIGKTFVTRLKEYLGRI